MISITEGCYRAGLPLRCTAGQSYQIAVDGYDGDTGSIAVALTLDAAVAPEPITDISLSRFTNN
jgi:hypothetical protein